MPLNQFFKSHIKPMLHCQKHIDNIVCNGVMKLISIPETTQAAGLKLKNDIVAEASEFAEANPLQHSTFTLLDHFRTNLCKYTIWHVQSVVISI